MRVDDVRPTVLRNRLRDPWGSYAPVSSRSFPMGRTPSGHLKPSQTVGALSLAQRVFDCFKGRSIGLPWDSTVALSAPFIFADEIL